jgi:SAM-dependent methyltransferase
MQRIQKHISPSPGRLLKQVFLQVRGLYYRGHRYTCPVCNHRFRKMLPGGFDLPVIREKHIIGAGRRENDICPLCQSTDRDRLIYCYLKYETDLFEQPYALLHIAPEPSLYKVFSQSDNLDYHPATKYAEGYYYSQKVETADLLDLHFDESTFDWVICNHVLEHIPNDRRAMHEIFRVLKPGGHAILQVPYAPSLEKTYEDPTITSRADREKYFGQFDHVRIYGRDYSERLEKAGFRVRLIHQEKDFKHTPPLAQFAVNPEEVLFLCEKPLKYNQL